MGLKVIEPLSEQELDALDRHVAGSASRGLQTPDIMVGVSANNLRRLLDQGQPHVHEPAYSPDPANYVSWDYARGFADGVLTADED